MSNISFRLSSSVLEWARTSIGYSIEQAAKKAGVSNERFKEWETGQKIPTYKQLETLAENVYKRPLALLLLQTPPKENTIQNDFRNLTNAEIDNISVELRIALRKAKRYQNILEEVASNKETGKFADFKVSLKDNPVSAAIRFRDFLNFTVEEQKLWSFDKAFNNFKNKIESIGIYVFQLKIPIQDARAFCLTGRYPIIVLNTDDSTNARIFSLFHELCHILFNTNSIFRDISTGELKKEYIVIENFCNQFAASFLVPDTYFENDIRYFANNSQLDEFTISKLAKDYNVSNEVIARKLLIRGLIKEDFFWAKKRSWDALAKSAKEKQKEKLRDQDPKGIAQDVKIIHEKGRPYVSNVVSAYQEGKISSADLSNYLETKLDHLPKIIDRLSN